MSEIKNRIIAILGWYGVLAILGSYTLLSLGVVEADSLVYQLLNLTGAGGLMIDAVNDKDHQPAVLNAFWMVIAVISMIRGLLA